MANFFQSYADHTEKSEYTAIMTMLAQGLKSVTPYSSGYYHLTAVPHVVALAAKTAVVALKLAMTPLLLIGALFYDPLNSIPAVFSSFNMQILTTLVNLANCALAIYSLISRSLLSLFCFGYANSQLNQEAIAETPTMVEGFDMSSLVQLGLTSASIIDYALNTVIYDIFDTGPGAEVLRQLMNCLNNGDGVEHHTDAFLQQFITQHPEFAPFDDVHEEMVFNPFQGFPA